MPFIIVIAPNEIQWVREKLKIALIYSVNIFYVSIPISRSLFYKDRPHKGQKRFF